ncbi:MAG: VOC family protein [Moraxella sp.]|nr:VOC family protein [Moraxella sp.]
MKINHYINYDGQAEAAFAFYASVFGGEPRLMRFGQMPAGDNALSERDANLIMHAELMIGEYCLMASDVVSGTCGDDESFLRGNAHSVSLNFTADEVDEATRLYHALSDGGVVVVPLGKTFWGAMFGVIKDKFGIQWMINCHL